MKRYLITRRRWKAPACVWLRWERYYGSPRRDLSVRVPLEDFRRDWLKIANKDGLDQTYYFRRTVPIRHNTLL